MRINFHNTHFETSAPTLDLCPGASVPEIAFAGRSNAGKSTAINTLCQRRQLAFASNTPGRTQLLNFFHVLESGDPIARLVDLPGYGYAQLSTVDKAAWDRELGGYLATRTSLRGCVMIVDSRRNLQDRDLGLLEFVKSRKLPVHIVLSKADKLKKQEKVQCLRQAKTLVKPWTDEGQAVSLQLWSATKKEGLEALNQQLSAWIRPESTTEEEQ
ncbi:MAG: ribosome biogenesis GTP-binding protein YihA/YsxC [Limnobacter sp.]|nr:ribosome biogenesis GTP-binding protein YihA/YsxC [Limnobacter sp.]